MRPSRSIWLTIRWPPKSFGLVAKAVDQCALERTAKIANLHDLVAEELSQQYKITVSEHGVRSSGGQRQRIGVARALSHNPRVPILNEVTSALDDLTEQTVMEAVYLLRDEITNLLFAYQLSAVKACATTSLLGNGELRAQGRSEELMQTDACFRAMTRT